MDDFLLSERGLGVADDRAGVVGPAVDPGLEDGLAGVDVVGVALDVVDRGVLLCREAPQIAVPNDVTVVGIDLPVVDVAEDQIGHEARLADGCGQGQIGRVGAEEDVVRDGFASRPPGQRRLDVYLDRSGRRLRLPRKRWNIVEADLAETVLRQCAPSAVDRESDVFGRYAGEVRDGVVGVIGSGGGLGQFHVAQGSPVHSIRRVLDRDLFDAKAQNQFELDVVVPDPELVELVGAIEFELNPDRIGAGGAAQPHVGTPGRVPARLVESRAVGDVLDAFRCLRDGIGRDDEIPAGIGEGFRREVPDISLEYGEVRCAVDFIHAPVIGLAEIKAAGIEGIDIQILGRGHGGIVHIGPIRSEVHVVRGRRRTRFPTQDHIQHDVVAVRWRDGIGGLDDRQCEHHRLEPVDLPSVRRAFLKCGQRDDVVRSQSQIRQRDDRMDRIAVNRVFVVLKQRLFGQGVIGVHAVGSAVAPAELNHHIDPNGSLHARRVALVLGVVITGGRIVVRVEEPVVVVSVGHSRRHVSRRGCENTVHRHRQIQFAVGHPCLNPLDVTVRIGHVGWIVHAGDLADSHATKCGNHPADGKRHQPQDAGCRED